ncbi:hypothetical protein HOD08_03790, partial [bacterium]|nr:hypothetical protein [bacterium]
EDKFIQRRKRTAPQSKPPKEKTISETIDLANELELVEEEIKEQVVENKELKTKLEAELKEHPKEKERYRDGGGYSAPYSSGYDRSDYGDRDDEYARDSSPYSSYGGNSSWRDYPNNYDYKYPKGKTGTTTSSNQGDGKKNQTFGGPLPQNERPLGGINEALDQFIGSAIVDKIIELGDEKFTYKTPEFFDTMTEAFSTIKFSELSQLVKTLDVKIKDRSEKDKPKKEPSKTKKKEETEKPEEKKIAEYKSKKLAMAPGLAKLTSYPVRFPAGKGKGDQTLHLPGMLYEAATARQLSKKVIEGHLKEVRHHIIALKDLCENLKKDTGFASKMTAAEKQIEKNADAYESEQSKQTLSTIELSNKNFKNPSALLKSLSALTDAGLKLRYEKPTIKSFQAHFQEKKSTGEKVHSLIRVTNNLIQGQKKSSQEIEQLKLAVKELEWAWTPELKGLAVKEATPGKGRQQPAQSQGGMPSPQEMAIFLRNMGMQDEQIQQALQDPQTIQQVVSLMHQQGQVGGPPHQQQRRPQSQPQQPQEPEKKWYQQIPIIGEFL